MNLQLPTFESARSRQVLVALIVATLLALGAYLGVAFDEELLEDVVEVGVEETLGPVDEELEDEGDPPPESPAEPASPPAPDVREATAEP